MFTDWQKMLEEIESNTVEEIKEEKLEQDVEIPVESTIPKIELNPTTIKKPSKPTKPVKSSATQTNNTNEQPTTQFEREINNLKTTNAKPKKDLFTWNMVINHNELSEVTSVEQLEELWPVTYTYNEDGSKLLQCKFDDRQFTMSRMYTPSFELYKAVVSMLLSKGIVPRFKSYDNLFTVLVFNGYEMIDQVHGVCSLTIRKDGQILAKFRHSKKAIEEDALKFIVNLLK